MRRIPAAKAILFAFAAGCSRTATSGEPMSSSTAAPSRTVVALTTQKPMSSAAQAIDVPTSTETPQGRTTVAILNSASAEQAASQFVQALIDGHASSDVPDVELWQQTLANADIIQTATLHDAADRASVAVSVAFDTPPGGEPTEPVGLLIDLRTGPSGWAVDGIGYL